MQPIHNIDLFQPSRPSLSQQERVMMQKQQAEADKIKGYDQLTELCRLGEYDLAKQLAQQNPQWGYTINNNAVQMQEEG